jgi:hypothetical protein
MEIRSPKPGVRKNFETRNPKQPTGPFRSLELGLRGSFGFRTSDFGFIPGERPRNFCLPCERAGLSCVSRPMTRNGDGNGHREIIQRREDEREH